MGGYCSGGRSRQSTYQGNIPSQPTIMKLPTHPPIHQRIRWPDQTRPDEPRRRSSRVEVFAIFFPPGEAFGHFKGCSIPVALYRESRGSGAKRSLLQNCCDQTDLINGFDRASGVRDIYFGNWNVKKVQFSEHFMIEG